MLNQKKAPTTDHVAWTKKDPQLVAPASPPTKKATTGSKVSELEVVDSLVAELVDIIAAGEDEQILSGWFVSAP